MAVESLATRSPPALIARAVAVERPVRQIRRGKNGQLTGNHASEARAKRSENSSA